MHQCTAPDRGGVSGGGVVIAQGLVYPMNTVHTVQSFLDTLCHNGLQFRIICAYKAVKGANCNRHSIITALWLNSPPPPPLTRTLVMSSLLYPPLPPGPRGA